MQAEEVIEGVIEHITFYAEDTGYTVLKFQPLHSRELLTVVGEMPPLHVGESVQMRGQWVHHPRHGLQFRAHYQEKLLPTTEGELEKYLGSGLIAGVGPATAKRLIQAFGVEIVTVIEQTPEKLLQIPKIGPKTQAQIVQSWQQHRGLQTLMIFLQKYDVSTSHALKIYKRYGEQAMGIVEKNPYQLAEDIWGFGFKSADLLAQKLGHARESVARLKAGLLYILQRSREQGHVYLPLPKLFETSAEILEVSPEILPPCLEELLQYGMVVLEKPQAEVLVYLQSFYTAEVEIAKRLQILLKAPVADPALDTFETWLADYETAQALNLSEEQKLAIESALRHKIFILTGGPGTGKTTVSRAILEWFEATEQVVFLASPTGRAAKRLSEVTEKPAQTIHRLLAYDPHRMAFQHNEWEPLDTDVVLLDEVSMVDIELFFQLLKALPATARLILIGDTDQLPSVGPGAVLRHLLDSKRIPQVTLTQIFRQAEASLIIRNAHVINQGRLPLLLPPLPAHRQEDAFFIEETHPQRVIQTVLDLVSRRLPQAGYTPRDIQVLCPMNRGLVGTQVLNQQMQALLNPSQPERFELQRGTRIFRVGDRVIQLKNNYDHEVYNGDIGWIDSLDAETQKLVVDYPDGPVSYDFSEVDELALAYALSVHKSQGSEYPVVVLPLVMQHYLMLQRNLLYTAMTRARRLFVLVGSRQALEKAVYNAEIKFRYSRLAERIVAVLEGVSIFDEVN